MILFQILVTAIILAAWFLVAVAVFEYVIAWLERREKRERQRNHYDF